MLSVLTVLSALIIKKRFVQQLRSGEVGWLTQDRWLICLETEQIALKGKIELYLTCWKCIIKHLKIELKPILHGFYVLLIFFLILSEDFFFFFPEKS